MRVGHPLLLLVLAAIFVNSNTAAATHRALRGARETDEPSQEERVSFSNSITGLTDKLKKVFETSDKKKLERAVKLVAKRADSRAFAKAKISPEIMYKAMGLEAKMGKYADWKKLSFTEQTTLFLKTRGIGNQQVISRLDQWDGYELAWANNIFNKVYV